MAFTGNFICTSFLQEILQAKHDFTATTGHTFKLALYTNSATFNASTTDYTPTNEVTGTGYVAGGAVLTSVTPAIDDDAAVCDFADLTFGTVTLTARGAIIYNTTADGGTGTTNAVAILDFGEDKTATGENFTISFPSADKTNAIVRISG